jgi:hypothetical protein
MYISRDVIFHEDQFPFAAIPLVSGPPSPVQEPVIPPLLPAPPVTSQLPISAAFSHSNFISSPPPSTSEEISMPNLMLPSWVTLGMRSEVVGAAAMDERWLLVGSDTM